MRTLRTVIAVLIAVPALAAATTRTIPRTVPLWSDLANERLDSPWQSLTVLEDGGIAVPIETASLPDWATNNWDSYKIAVSDSSGNGKWVRADMLDASPMRGKWFAMSTAAADNSVALQAALDLMVLKGGGTLEIGGGIYNFTNQVSLDSIYGKGITIRGTREYTGSSGEIYTLFRSSYDGGPQFYFYDSVGSSGGAINIENIEFKNNGSSQLGLKIENANGYFELRNCIFAFYTHADGAFQVSKTHSAVMSDVSFTSCTRAFTIGGGGDDWFSNTYLERVSIGTSTDASACAVIKGGTSANQVFSWDGGKIQSTSAGILLDDVAYADVRNLYMEGVADSGAFAVKADNYFLVTLHNLFIAGTSTAAGIEIGTADSAPSPIRIVQCGFANVTDPISVTGTAQEIIVEECAEGGATAVHVVVNGGSTPLGWSERFKGETRFFDSSGNEVTQIGGADGAVQGLITASTGTALGAFQFAENSWITTQDGSENNLFATYMSSTNGTTLGNWFGSGTYRAGDWAEAQFFSAYRDTTADVLYPSFALGGYSWPTSATTTNIGKIYIDAKSNGSLTFNAPTTVFQYELTFERDAPFSIGIQRSEGVNAPGKDLTIAASTATSGSSNQEGGDVVIQSGISTGSGTGEVIIKTSPGTAAVTTDNTRATSLTVTGTGELVFARGGITHDVDTGTPAGGTYSPDLLAADVFTVSMGGDLVLTNAVNAASGRGVQLRILNDQATNCVLYLDDWNKGGDADPITVGTNQVVRVTLQAFGTDAGDIDCASALLDN